MGCGRSLNFAAPLRTGKVVGAAEVVRVDEPKGGCCCCKGATVDDPSVESPNPPGFAVAVDEKRPEPPREDVGSGVEGAAVEEVPQEKPEG